jgi:hypothetical protein
MPNKQDEGGEDRQGHPRHGAGEALAEHRRLRPAGLVDAMFVERFHSYFFYIWFQRRRSKWLMKFIYNKYLGWSHSIKTIGCEHFYVRERSPPSLLLHSHTTLQPNNERNDFTLFYSLTK